MGQSNEIIQRVVQRYPRARCLWCGNFDPSMPKGFNGEVGFMCKVGAVIPCGGAFNPKQGGDLVPA